LKGVLCAMYVKASKLGTLLTAQMLGEKEETPSSVGDCITRKMTPDDWEKYGPLNISESKIIKKSKTFNRGTSHVRP